MPSGSSCQSIVALETISLSRVIAKRWKLAWGSEPGGRTIFEPRSATRAVTFWNALRPSSVNSNVTTGCCVVGSVCCSGFLTSLPDSSESSSSTKNWLNGTLLGRSSGRSFWTITIPRGTLITRLPDGGPFGPSSSSCGAHSVSFGILRWPPCSSSSAKFSISSSQLA